MEIIDGIENGATAGGHPKSKLTTVEQRQLETELVRSTDKGTVKGTVG